MLKIDWYWNILILEHILDKNSKNIIQTTMPGTLRNPKKL